MTPEDNHQALDSTSAQKSSVKAHLQSFGARLKRSALFRTRRRTIIILPLLI